MLFICKTINQLICFMLRSLGNFVTISIDKFYGCNISLLKSNNLITLHLKSNQIFVINLLILTESYNFVKFYCMFVITRHLLSVIQCLFRSWCVFPSIYLYRVEWQVPVTQILRIRDLSTTVSVNVV